MKDLILKSDCLTVHVNALGAELKGVEKDGLEFLWQGDKDSYPRTSPTLFPIMGRFLSDTYYVGDKAYNMGLNGIAMDLNFTCLSHTENQAVFQLKADDRTRKSYPFEFALTVTYTAKGNQVFVDYKVENKGDVPMPFCLGCHTAYNWPLVEGDASTDYRLVFEKDEDLESFNPFGWREPGFVKGKVRPLSHDLFENFTRSFTGIQSDWFEYGSDKHDRKVRIYRKNFPFIAMWTMPIEEAKLVCLEPSTSVQPGNHPGLHLEDRLGAITLAPGEVWENGFSVEFI